MNNRKKRHLIHIGLTALALTLVVGANQGWANGGHHQSAHRIRARTTPAPHVDPSMLHINFRHKCQRMEKDTLRNGAQRTKLYHGGKRIGTQIRYPSGTEITYRRGSPSFVTHTPATRALQSRIQNPDFQGPAMRVVTKAQTSKTTGRPAERTTAHVIESQTGRHTKDGEQVAGGHQHLSPWQWTRIDKDGKTTVYMPVEPFKLEIR
jgi:hypothetical protein